MTTDFRTLDAMKDTLDCHVDYVDSLKDDRKNLRREIERLQDELTRFNGYILEATSTEAIARVVDEAVDIHAETLDEGEVATKINTDDAREWLRNALLVD